MRKKKYGEGNLTQRFIHNFIKTKKCFRVIKPAQSQNGLLYISSMILFIVYLKKLLVSLQYSNIYEFSDKNFENFIITIVQKSVCINKKYNNSKNKTSFNPKKKKWHTNNLTTNNTILKPNHKQPEQTKGNTEMAIDQGKILN